MKMINTRGYKIKKRIFNVLQICVGESELEVDVEVASVCLRLSSSLSLLIIPRRQPSATTNTADARTISNSTYTCSMGVCSVTLHNIKCNRQYMSWRMHAFGPESISVFGGINSNYPRCVIKFGNEYSKHSRG